MADHWRSENEKWLLYNLLFRDKIGFVDGYQVKRQVLIKLSKASYPATEDHFKWLMHHGLVGKVKTYIRAKYSSKDFRYYIKPEGIKYLGCSRIKRDGTKIKGVKEWYKKVEPSDFFLYGELSWNYDEVSDVFKYFFEGIDKIVAEYQDAIFLKSTSFKKTKVVEIPKVMGKVKVKKLATRRVAVKTKTKTPIVIIDTVILVSILLSSILGLNIALPLITFSDFNQNYLFAGDYVWLWIITGLFLNYIFIVRTLRYVLKKSLEKQNKG